MKAQKKALKARYKKAVRMVERENDIMNRSRDRKYYWQKQIKFLENKLELSNEGQLELPF